MGLTVLALLVGGCAATAPTTPHLTAQMSRAQAAIEQAEDIEAREYAPLVLRKAEKKLNDAQTALAGGKPNQAERLAEQALIDAELAAVSTQSAKAQATARELRESISTLRAEIRRQRNN